MLGLPVPDLVLVELDPALARSEPDEEIHGLLERSAGTNVGLDFLPGSLPFAPRVPPLPDADLAASVVWFDALVMNIDRTARNPNLLVWHRPAEGHQVSDTELGGPGLQCGAERSAADDGQGEVRAGARALGEGRHEP